MMKFRYAFASCAGFVLLAGCGGGSGGVASTPAPTPSPSPSPTPPPANITMKNLTRSQSFTNDAASLSGSWDLASGTDVSGSASGSTLEISYDAATGGYSVSGGGHNLAVSPADVLSSDNIETIYTKSGATGNDRLTLVKVPYSNATNPQYVAMGYWQHSETTGSTQNTDVTAFSYGLPSAASAVPRAGSAAYAIDAFGVVTAPGEEPSTLQGSGHLSVDFAHDIFTAQADLEQYALVNGSTGTGGGLELRAGGHLSSTGTFAGNAVVGSLFGQATGTIDGRFYGPTAQEVGASFSATNNSTGLAAAGSFVGQRDGSYTPDNQTLLDPHYPESFYTDFGGNLIGSLTWLNAETFDFGPPVSDMGGGRFTIGDKVASGNANFTTYKKHVVVGGYGDQDVVLELYKSGTANTELALTYASFGHWAGTRDGTTQNYYFDYGYKTGEGFLSARTGTAHYEGAAYGTGLSADGTAHFDVNGTSLFDVDFTHARFTGALMLAGRQRENGRSVDFGQFDLVGSEDGRAALLSGTQSSGAGYFNGHFYGPNAEELAGTFFLIAPQAVDGKDVGIQGATAAARK